VASSALQSKPCGHDAIEFVASFDDKYQLAALFKAAALGQRSPEDIAKAFQNSKPSPKFDVPVSVQRFIGTRVNSICHWYIPLLLFQSFAFIKHPSQLFTTDVKMF
jgi:hypothetical protein